MYHIGQREHSDLLSWKGLPQYYIKPFMCAPAATAAALPYPLSIFPRRGITDGGPLLRPTLVGLGRKDRRL